MGDSSHVARIVITDFSFSLLEDEGICPVGRYVVLADAIDLGSILLPPLSRLLCRLLVEPMINECGAL